MGYALAEAARDAGHDVLLVSGPVHLPVPRGCETVRVNTTAEMRDACVARFAQCDGVIAAAAVCDYKPLTRVAGKIAKTGGPITFEMIETDDVLAELGRRKDDRWVLGFALEATNARENALQKLREELRLDRAQRTSAIGAEDNSVEMLDGSGQVVTKFAGTKPEVARHLIAWIDSHVRPRSDGQTP